MQTDIVSTSELRIGVPFEDIEMGWLEACIQFRLGHLSGDFPQAPPLRENTGSYAGFLRQENYGHTERLVLALALACELRPDLLMMMLEANGKSNYHGIQYLESTKEFSPTIHSIRFLLGELSREILDLFLNNNSQLVGKAIELRRDPNQISVLSTKFCLSPEFLHSIVWERGFSPGTFFSFPAQEIHTSMTWGDLVIPNEVEEQIGNIDLWLKHGASLARYWESGYQFKPGYRVLFHGPPGTGKTLTATLLGKENEREVYRIDLSQVVSKYIGETEKQLKKVFDKAANRNWILFFDEADSLFGKRGKVSDARDRYANQEISYLLQRIEDFEGLVILATNLKENMDEAFIRRFQCVIRFVKPAPPERLRLWKNVLPSGIPLEEGLHLEEVAKKYDLTGAAIVNVVQYVSLKALALPSPTILEKDLIQGIRTEYQKDNRLL